MRLVTRAHSWLLLFAAAYGPFWSLHANARTRLGVAEALQLLSGCAASIRRGVYDESLCQPPELQRLPPSSDFCPVCGFGS